MSENVSPARESIATRSSELAGQTEVDLTFLRQTRFSRVGEKTAIAALGAIPWVGGVAAALATLKTEDGQLQTNELLRGWLSAHEQRMAMLERDVRWLVNRIEMLGEEAVEWAESEEYLALVHKAFQGWDRAGTEEKRRYFAGLLANAAGTRMCSDDLIRLFIDWIDRYHESHFTIIRFVYQNPGATKYEIGVDLLGEDLPADNSAEADLFRELFRELNMSGIVRQARGTDEDGRFLRRQPTRRAPKGMASRVMESSFEDSKPQVLTELGKQFVHYVLDDVVPRLDLSG
jgi:hypothetical protein